jgi:hypothetical protein
VICLQNEVCSCAISVKIAQRFTFGSIPADFESLEERNGSQPCSPENDCLVRPSGNYLGFCFEFVK